MPILSILISLISCIISALTIYRRRTDANPSQSEPRSKFSVSQYLECAEKAYLEILEQQEPFEYEIVLWWGFDGVRLNKDGSPEWISRKQELITTPEGYAKLICPLDTRNLCNSKARIDVYNIADVWTQNRLDMSSKFNPAVAIFIIEQMSDILDTMGDFVLKWNQKSEKRLS